MGFRFTGGTIKVQPTPSKHERIIMNEQTAPIASAIAASIAASIDNALPPEPVTQARTVEQIIIGQATTDGDGVKLTRVLQQALQTRLDPFLMLDAFGADDPQDYIGGFPDHPHRGFETVTYMLTGRMRHHDSAGNAGLLQNGGVQWMSAGRGVIHSELPEQEAGRMEGFQLWLNLAAKDKMSAPWYKDFQDGEIPQFRTGQGATVRVIAGSSHGVAGAMQREVTEPLYLDLHLEDGAVFSQAMAAHMNAFVYVYRGQLQIGEQSVPQQRMAILRNDAGSDGVILRAHGASRAILIAGRPLREPIVQHGPFVMNTQAEILQAISDYRTGKLAA
jgi:redox-sensitive bicupin YhaK (pirin superfamily)